MVSKHKVYRDAVSGEYVSQEYAEANPDTTVSEEIEDNYDEGVTE